MPDVGDVSAAQGDGTAPVVLVSGAAAGESGVSVCSVSYRGAVHFQATLRTHVVCFSSPGELHCRRAGECVTHDAPEGSLAIHPAGLDCSAEADHDVLTTYVVIDPVRLSLA